ncbi:MAG TPA: DUF58 domain-containing protein [Polyangiaceae bacterium]|nr:DUF58 domain-containing protein [Polyangiaceae bacterium]
MTSVAAEPPSLARKWALPSRRLIVLFALPLPLLLVFPGRGTTLVAVVYDVVLLIAALADAWLPPRANDVAVSREARPSLALGANQRVEFRLRNGSQRPVSFELVEDLPPTFIATPEIVRGVVSAESRAFATHDVRPTERGLHVRGHVHVRFASLLGLVVKRVELRESAESKVYPNVVNLARHELATRRHRLSELGVAPTRLYGEGSDFESLRDYVPGDNPTDVAWKATARRGRLITRNYQVERSQNILVVLDCGRLMTTEVDGMSRLDHAINAALLLSYVAMKQGDYIGLLAFSDAIEAYVPPVRGAAALGRMNEALYRIEARPHEADYDRACRFLALKHRKRSLVVIITDVVDNEASSMLLAHAARFARHHLPLCVTLRNLDVERLANAEPTTELDPYRQAVALDLLQRRRVAIEEMRRTGVNVLDVDPRQLGPRLLNRYLELKKRLRI